MPHVITFTTTRGHVTEDGGWDRDTVTHHEDVWTLEDLYDIDPGRDDAEPDAWEARSAVHAAVDALRRKRFGTHSGSHWYLGGWYITDPYENPYTGEREEGSARLTGFTDEESRAVCAEICGPHAKKED